MTRFLGFLVLVFTCAACSGGGGDAPGSTAVAPSPGAVAGAAPTGPAAPPADPLDAQLRAAMAQAGVQPLAPPPPQDPSLVALGEALMFDKLLSGNRDISCATCHHPQLATADGLSTSIGTGGVGLGPARGLGTGSFIGRNAPALWNLAGVQVLFHDGRVSGNPQQGFATPAGPALPEGLDSALAAQAMFPVATRDEMVGNPGENELADFNSADLHGIWGGLMARLLAVPEYVALFAAAFPAVSFDQLGFQHAANAIAAFESERFTALNSPFDRYVAGDDTALTAAQKRGALLFYGRARCSQCHSGPLLSDFAFHNIAAPQIGPGQDAEAPLDFGRGGETGNPGDRFLFRTPMLRHVALTAPYTHAGAYTSLQAIVRHYVNPARALQNYDPGQLDPRFQDQVHVQEQLAAGVLDNLDPLVAQPNPLNPGEVQDLVSFLEALTDPGADSVPVPASVPSGLPVL